MRNLISTLLKPIRSVVFIAVILPSSLFGQGDSLRRNADVFRFADGVLHTFSAPARWDGRDWAVLSGLVLGTSALTFSDQPVRSFWQSQDNRFLDGLERVGYHYGKPYTAVGITGGFYLSGIIFRSEWAKETALMLGTSIFSSSLVMGLMKSAAGRARPGPEVDNLEFRPFHDSPAFHAFPSGHSSVAFGISLVLAKRVEYVPLKILFYSLAGTTAVSRMYSDAHWVSDVAFGGMLAWFFADTAMERIQVNRFRKIKRGLRRSLVWNVFPYPGGLTLRAKM